MNRRGNYPERSFWHIKGDAETVRQGMQMACASERDYYATCQEISAMREKTEAFRGMLEAFVASEQDKTRQVALLTNALNNAHLRLEERAVLLRLVQQIVAAPKLLDARALMGLTLRAS